VTRILPGVHGLRAIAALGVALYHVAMLIRLPPSELMFVRYYFSYGVPLFFVISGFSLALSTLPQIGRENWMRAYFMKRFFRIAPLFYALLVFRVLHRAARGRAFDVADIVLNVTFTFNLVPGKHESIVAAGWTIGVEMVFYALLPAILVCARGWLATAALALVAVAISLSARAIFPTLEGLPSNYAVMSFASNVQFFAIGILAYHVFDALKQRPVGSPRVGAAGTAVTVGLLMMIVLGPLTYVNGANTPLWGLLFGVLCIWQALAPGRVNGSRAFVYLGERSYSIYLLHPMVILLPRQHWRAWDEGLTQAIGDWSFVVISVAVLGLTIALSVVSYALIEVPGMRLGSHLIRTRLVPTARPSGVANW
jgi:peptidoglycan/LPS O-acetylase OafA/YrhL